MMIDPIQWNAVWLVEKYLPDCDEPYESIIIPGNLLVTGGAGGLWNFLNGNPATLDAFDNAHAMLAVDDSTAAETTAQIDIQAVTNRKFKAMAATYPIHSFSQFDTATKSIIYKSSFTLAEANYAWNEFGLFNGPDGGGALMLNRKVAALGTKPNTEVWDLTLTISMA